MLGLDVPLFGRKPFEGFSVDRVKRAIHCWRHTRVPVADPSNLMVASHGHDPHHVLFLVTISTLLSYTVGITVAASLYHSTSFYATRKRNANVHTFPQLGTDTVLDTISSCSAPPARRASRPSSASTRYLLSTNKVLFKSHVFSHITQTKFKAEDDTFLDMLQHEYSSGIYLPSTN